jgi:uncharacterized protein YunC (DUF1805 family)
MMIKKKLIQINAHEVMGIEVDMPKGVLVAAIGNTAFVMCGYLNVDIAEKMGDTAAIVRGVKTVEELLSGSVVSMTSPAKSKGVTPGMTGREALEKMLS